MKKEAISKTIESWMDQLRVRIKILRSFHGLGHEELSRMTNMSKATIGKLEKPEPGARMQVENIAEVALAMGMAPEVLMGSSDDFFMAPQRLMNAKFKRPTDA